MREFFGYIFILSLHLLALALSSIGIMFTSAATMVSIIFSRYAVRHDDRYAITPKEKAEPGLISKFTGKSIN